MMPRLRTHHPLVYASRVTDPRNPPGTSLRDPGDLGVLGVVWGEINLFLPQNQKFVFGGFPGGINFCQSPEHKNWCPGGELIFSPSLNSSLNTIVQGKLFLWSPRTNFYFVLGQMDFFLPQTKFLDVSLLSGGKQLGKLLTCPTKQGDIWALQKSV